MSDAAPDLAWRPRLAGIVLVLVQCATLALLEGGYAFGAVAGALALGSLLRPLQIPPRQAPHWLWTALLGLVLAIKYRLAPEHLPEQITFFNTVLGYEAARFLIFVQLMQLYLRRPTGRFPDWFAAIACLSMVFASNVRLSPTTQPISQVLCMAFVIALAMFAHSNRAAPVGGGRWVARTILLLVLLIAGFAGAETTALLRKFEDDLASFLAKQSGALIDREVTRGFSGRGAIGDITGWKAHAAEHIALRIRAPQAPGYLRGMVFDEFHQNYWTSSADQRVLGSVESPRIRPLRGNEELYQLPLVPPEVVPGRILDVWPDDLTGPRLFAPLEAVYIAVTPTPLGVTSNDLVVRPDGADATPYSLFLAAAPPPSKLDDEQREFLLVVDEELSEMLQPLADELFADCRTASEKLDAARKFFLENFEYALIPQVRRGRSLIAGFLEQRLPGHCELFASGGAILLRLAGVPTRYVTGYVATEYNSAGSYWVVRRRDAHAWLEAYDDELHRWVTVECTPPLGIPHSTAAGGWSEWFDARRQAWEEWMHRLSGQGPLAALAAIASVPGLAAILCAVVAVLIWKHRQTPRPLQFRRDPVDDLELSRLLRQGDRLARRLGCRRAPAETVSSFARRLRTTLPVSDRISMLADWYERYVRVRYGKPLAGDWRSELRQQLNAAACRPVRR